MLGRGLLHHVLDRRHVVRPARAVAEVLVGELPALHRIGEPRTEALELFVGGDVEEDLDQPHARVDQHPLELVDLAIGAPPFRLAGEALDALDQHPAVPRAVEGDDLAVLRQAAPEALQIVLGALVLVGRGDRTDPEAARIERPAEAAHDAALAGGVPALEDDDRALRRAEIGLLDELQHALQRSEPPLVVGEVEPRMFDDVGEPRPPRDDKVLRPQRLVVRHARPSPDAGDAPAKRKRRPFAAAAQSVWPPAARRFDRIVGAGAP